ncbi:Sulfotransferase domain-containing protein [Algoriphagus locisalis]|uniref:Sulfotransferase domain-containing protein n=1 Tax=Algoriphagus locisalis TaxID=305507 RepID=A0A1I6Y4I0_9BACT|nr:sulfotransferase [Algoriphagus locisalis]SFT45565.1 Sulfotransferase domain-containing protein [Algoriphagus locisalis]
MNKSVDFLVIGVQKGATSWLYQCLSDHPEISVPIKKKEIEYLGGELWKARGDDWYLSLIPNIEGKVSGDVSVEYIFDSTSAEILKEKFPNVKLILSLRNPQERAISAFFWYLRKGKIDISDNISTFFNREIEMYSIGRSSTDILSRGIYYDQICRYLEFFSSHQLKIVLFDEIENSPQTVMSNIYSFLGVDTNFVSHSIDTAPKRNSFNQLSIYLENKFPNSKVISKLVDLINQSIKVNMRTKNDLIKDSFYLTDFYSSHIQDILSLPNDIISISQKELIKKNWLK